MGYFRINIYLSFLNFLKSFFISNINEKRIEKLITQTSKKKKLYFNESIKSRLSNLAKVFKKKIS